MNETKALEVCSGNKNRIRFSWLAAVWSLLFLALFSAPASAQHTSVLCPPQTATVSAGGTVTINISACEFPGNGGINAIDGGSFGAPDFENHGTATTRQTSGWFLDYSHNGSTGIGSTDVFEITDGSLAGSGDVLVTITITASASPITVSPASLPTLTAGAPFSQTLTSAGGVAPYTYALQSGALPVGVSLSSGGVLSGTPTQRGAYSFSVRSTDATSPTAQFVDRGYTGTVQNPSLAITPTSATAIQNVAFSQTLSAIGGVAPYTFQLETGSFPAGISISSGGVISGTTAAAPGNYPVTIRVTDSSTGPGSYFEVESFTLTVSPPPSVSISVSPSSLSEDSAPNLIYTVTRSLNISSPTTVNITTGGTATSGTDYTGGVATVVIPAGATTATITINPSVDSTVEANETVILTVASGTGYTVGAPASATGTILNDDVPSATIAVSPASVGEDGASNLVFTVTLNQASFSATSVNFTIGGTATNGTDYATIASPLVIAAGNTTGTITVNPTADATIEGDETVIITLNAGASYSVGAPSSATGNILNDDLPNLTINDVTANEGNAGVTNFTFTVSLSAPAGPGGVSFDIATANGTATAGVDFITNTLTNQTIPAGSSTYTFTVLVNGDLLNEPSELFFVNVTNVINAVMVDGQGLGTIANDDPLPSLSINDVTVTEGSSGTVNAVFTVTLSAASGQTVTVNYATADGTATQPADYTSTSGSLVFTAGTTTRSITVPVMGDIIAEASESFFVNLSGATNATISDNQGAGTITNAVQVPDAPVIGTATAGIAQASVTFTAPVNNGGAAISGYTVTASPGGLTGTGASSPITVAGLTNGVAYTFTVTATNSAGTGAASAASNSATPVASQSITFNNPGPQNFGSTPTLTASATSGLTPSFTSSTTGVCTITSSGLLSFVATGACTINADQAGNAGLLPALQVSQTFTVNPVAPGAPTGASATAGNAQATVSFTAPISNGGAAITGYTVTSSPGGLTGAGGSSPITVNGLTNGVAYTFTVTATNSAGTGAASAASNSVTPVSPPPVASAVSATVAYGSSNNAITLNLSGGTAVSVAVASAPANGTATASGTSISYTPNPTFSGTDTFAYTATNTGGTSAPATVTITVNPQAPVAGAVTTTVAYGSSSNAITLALSGGTATSVAVASAPANGTATASGTSISYTPNPTFSGTDTFTYTATNAGGTSAAATVTIAVTPQVPVVNAVSATVAYGSSNNVIPLNVTGGAPSSVAVASAPANGTATVSGTSISYTPNPTFSGSDSFTYTATNAGGSSAPATVTITVNPQTPVAGNVTITVEANSSANLVPLAISGGVATSVALASAPANGTAVVSGTEIRYTPNANFSGSDSFTYTATNTGGTSAPATVSVTVLNRPDPSKDAEVRGLLHAQAASAKRFGQAQISNFQTRLESLHGRMRHSANGDDALVGLRAEPASFPTRAPSPRGDNASHSVRVDPAVAYRREIGLPGAKAGADPFALPQKQDYRQLVSLMPGPLSSLSLASTRSDVYGSGVDVWTAGSINIGTQSDEELRFTTSGVSMGADKRFGNTWALGIGAGFGHERQKVGSHGSRSTGNAYSLAVYGSYQPVNGLFLDGLIGHSTLDFDSRRHVTGIGSEALASRQGTQWFASFTTAYEYAKRRDLLSPYARLDLVRTHLKQATEQGAGAYNLAYFAQDSESTKLAIGLRGETEIQLANGSMTPFFRLEYQREFDEGGVSKMTYADALNGPIYRLDGLSVDRDTLVLGMGSQWRLQRVWNLGLGYRYSHGSASTRVHGFTASINRQF